MTRVGSAPKNKIGEEKNRFPAGISLMKGWLFHSNVLMQLKHDRVKLREVPLMKFVMFVLVLQHMVHV